MTTHQTNFGMGRTYFIRGGTVEIRILTDKPDYRGCYMASLRDLTTGKRSLAPVRVHAVDARQGMRLDFQG